MAMDCAGGRVPDLDHQDVLNVTRVLIGDELEWYGNILECMNCKTKWMMDDVDELMFCPHCGKRSAEERST